MTTLATTDDPTALTIAQRTELLDTELAYQAARAELADAAAQRYARLWAIYLASGRDARSVLAESPGTVTRATLAGAIRRHAAGGDWVQLALFELEHA
jgi:hypothetical protein